MFTGLCSYKEVDGPSTGNPPGHVQCREEPGNLVWMPGLPGSKLLPIICHSVFLSLQSDTLKVIGLTARSYETDLLSRTQVLVLPLLSLPGRFLPHLVQVSCSSPMHVRRRISLGSSAELWSARLLESRSVRR